MNARRRLFFSPRTGITLTSLFNYWRRERRQTCVQTRATAPCLSQPTMAALTSYIIYPSTVPTFLNRTIKTNKGLTALHIAAWNGHVDSLNRLLLAGAPPDLQTQDKNTPLSLAAHGNHPDIIDVLLPLGCDVNNADRDLDTSLHYAAYNGMSETVEKLILCGADPNARNRVNTTPLWNAVYYNRQDVVKQLLLANVDMEVASVGIDQHAQSDLVHYLYDQPMSPLLVSVKRNLPHLALLLVAAGYDIFKEQWLVRQEFPDSLTSNNELLSLLSHSILNPPSLLKVCRTFIRRHLGRNVTKTMRTLEIPTTLKNYLTLNDLMN
ncbi:hypothetical protein ScPMuIL_014300 [Solemya velum]